jgi:hypothetical protein
MRGGRVFRLAIGKMTQKTTNASTSNDITAKGGEANSRVGQNRMMSKDYERLPESSEVFIYVAMMRLMVRPIPPRSLTA